MAANECYEQMFVMSTNQAINFHLQAPLTLTLSRCAGEGTTPASTSTSRPDPDSFLPVLTSPT